MAAPQRGGSFLYRLDPRTKLLLAPLFTVLIFYIDSLAVSAALMLFFTALCFSAGISFRELFPHRKFLLFLILFVITLQTLFGRETPAGSYLLNPLVPDWVPVLGGRGSLKLDGLLTGLMISCRIVGLSALLPALTMTTEKRLLAYGITRLGINYRAAHIITSTLNMIPSFEEETRSIIEARKLRGIRSFEEGNFFAKLGEYPAITLPLMIRAMRKALMVSLAMDARAFGAFKTRTWLLSTKMSPIDGLTFTAGICFSAAAVAVNCILKR